jgi:hypothetical protein
MARRQGGALHLPRVAAAATSTAGSTHRSRHRSIEPASAGFFSPVATNAGGAAILGKVVIGDGRIEDNTLGNRAGSGRRQSAFNAEQCVFNGDRGARHFLYGRLPFARRYC